ncbi:MAG: hypothetical protein AMXMBFR33_43360 [Candidatus Xenobia bacterium]
MLQNLFRPTELGEFVDCQGERIIFKSSRPYEMGKKVQLRLTLPDHPRVRIQVGTCRSLPGGGYVVVGRLLKGVRLPGGSARPEPFLRQSRRFPCRTRVLSRCLPGFRAMTLDVSSSGVQLETDGKMPVGIQIQMVLELGEQGPGLSCQARVAWCAPHDEQNRFRVGLEFLSPSQELLRGLESLARRAAPEEFELMTGRFKELTPQEPPPRRDNELRTPMKARLERYSIEDDLINLRLRTPDGDLRKMVIRSPKAVVDRRGSAGLEVEELGRSEAPGKHNYRLLNGKREPVLEIEADPS